MSLTGQFEVPGISETGVEFTNTQTSEVSYTFSPSGKWTPGKDNPSLAGCNAEGLKGYSIPVQEGIKPYLPQMVPYLKYPNNTPFALLAVNKTTGAVTEVGKETTIVLKSGETLIFILNDMSWGYYDNEGAIAVNWSEVSNAAPKVIIYEDANFQGASQELTEGSYNMASLTIGNDKLSSLRVPAGFKVTIYEHEFSGRSNSFTKDTSWVGDDFNDITSSVKVEKISTIAISSKLATGNIIALQADNGKYLSRINRGANYDPIEAAKGSIDPYCQFVVTVLADSKIALKADTGKYWSRINRGNVDPIEAAKDSIDAYSQFVATFSADGKLILQAENGKFLSRITRGSIDAIEAAKASPDVFCQFGISIVSADNKASNKEIEQCKSIISELQLYKQRNWAIGLNGDTLQPDGFVAFFTARSLPFEYYVRSGGVSRGDASAYDRNIATLENYIKSL